ncbi:SANT/Myb_domain [Hexamita inflata]|uniref:SANT/Myb domain n=1 Tax=Hexamita inflata TaxID=28002 RepID=A0AA86UV98_9EUKA|nr:SANT/Myb domain [Hexamita inflata]
MLLLHLNIFPAIYNTVNLAEQNQTNTILFHNLPILLFSIFPSLNQTQFNQVYEVNKLELLNTRYSSATESQYRSLRSLNTTSETMASRKVSKWTDEEQLLFEKLVEQYEKDFRRIAAQFPGRNYNQIRSHYYNEQYKDVSNSSSPSLTRRPSSESLLSPSPSSRQLEVESPEETYFALFSLFE